MTISQKGLHRVNAVIDGVRVLGRVGVGVGVRVGANVLVGGKVGIGVRVGAFKVPVGIGVNVFVELGRAEGERRIIWVVFWASLFSTFLALRVMAVVFSVII